MLGASTCEACAGDHAAVNLGFVYHLVRGTAFDPWMRLGMGYRTVDYEGKAGAPKLLVPGRFHGWDWLDISLGGTFFPTPSFGLGPFLSANVGSFLARPEAAGDSGAPRVYAFFQFGFRFVLDPARWFSKTQPKPTTAMAF